MRIVRSAFALVALSVAGCAVDVAAPDIAADAPPLSESWTVASNAINRIWDSGVVFGLSPRENIHCHADQGEGWMLTRLNVFQQGFAAPDFIARMTGVCREFDVSDPLLPWTGLSWTKLIFSGPSVGAGPFPIQVPNGSYPIGMELRVDNGSTRVKDVRFKHAPKNLAGNALDLAAASFTSWGTGYAGVVVPLNCPNQHVVTGVDLQYDVANGPIRYVELHCRQLMY